MFRFILSTYRVYRLLFANHDMNDSTTLIITIKVILLDFLSRLLRKFIWKVSTDQCIALTCLVYRCFDREHRSYCLKWVCISNNLPGVTHYIDRVHGNHRHGIIPYSQLCYFFLPRPILFASLHQLSSLFIRFWIR